MPFRGFAGVTIGSFFVRLILVLLLMAGVFLFLNRGWFGTYAAQFRAPDGRTAAGTWVGVLEATGADGQALPGKAAAITLILKLQDAFVQRYTGSGELCVADEPAARAISDVNLSIDSSQQLSGHVGEDPERVPQALYHTVAGKFTPDKIDFSRFTFPTHDVLHHPSYSSSGMLHVGSKAEYEKLCSQLRESREYSKP